MTEDVKEILLNSSNSKTSVNGDMLLNIDLSSDEKKFPSNSISDNIDQYKQYVKEKDASNKYRFVFTINSVCSNVLYNHVSEIIKDSARIESSGMYVKGVNNKYIKYKYGQEKKLYPNLLIKDTGYSHPNCGNFTYMPGIDIFNNHRFRGEEFVIIADKASSTCPEYNTIEDTVREYNGATLKSIATESEGDTHLYFKDTFKTYPESIKDNLIERDGWFGFINPTSLDIVNCKLESSSISINKVINNRKACEFIDLYPDRTLFSFMPKKNNTLKREEYNWDYCITYPYSSFTENELVSLLDDTGKKSVLNGMLTEFCDSSGNKLTDDSLNNLLSPETNGEEFSDIMLRTRIKNNLKSGDYIKIHLVIDGVKYFTIKTNIKVRNVGIGGYNTMYYFTVNKGDILSGLKTISNLNGSLDGLHCYVQRISNGRPCKYYFRKFRRLPNFKNTNIHNDEKLTNNAIKEVIFNNFNSSLNKLGFGTNIYGDRMAQIVYTDDVDTSNIYDNLGRVLHEVYLTIIKANRGNTLWYTSKKYSNEGVECSHCFGNVSSGLDLPWPYGEDEDDYNVHKIHNIPSTFGGNPSFPKSVKHLEKYITQSGASKENLTVLHIENNKPGKPIKRRNNYDGVFLGDIVELDELNVEEYILEDVCHRFNTMQREYVTDGEFSAITINEIERDDYDLKGFKVTTENYLDNYRINLAAEGYYYKAHYRIPIREFSEIVNEGQHTIVKFDELITVRHEQSLSIFEGTTDKNYYFQKGDEIIIYGKNKYIGVITNVYGDDFRNIKFIIYKENIVIDDTNKLDFNFFKPNVLKPSTAYDFDDGSGVYRWRNIESFEYLRTDSELYDGIFTNGAHYIHKNINFFLRRQDPYGLYGLNPVNNEAFDYRYQSLEQPGKEEDITPAQHFTEGDIQLC